VSVPAATGGVGIITRLFGTAISGAAGFAAGTALGPTLSPIVRLIANDVNAHFPYVPPSASTLALGVAQGQVEEGQARSWAAMHGIGEPAFTALVNIANTGPGSTYAFELWRRGVISEAAFRRALTRLGIEPEWIDDLVKIKQVLLSPAELANARQQGFIDDARQLADAEKQGLNADEATIQFELAGLPPGAATAQEYLNRGLIDQQTFAEMIREGHTKTKYTDVLRRGAEYVLSPISYVEGRLRGWITDAEMYAGTHLSGVTQPDTDLLFKIHGRPISFRQTFIGTRRGGTLDGPIADIDPAFLASLRRSNIQPPFYNLAWAQRYTYPSAFVLRALTQSGDITQARAEQVLLYEGWEPGFATQVSEAWATGGGAAGKELTKAELMTEFEGGYITENELRDHLAALGYSGPALDLEVHLGDARRIRGWRDKAITALGKRYVASTMESAAADGYLVEIGVPDPDTRASIIRIWDIEREFK
jgi:hypothetical protein